MASETTIIYNGIQIKNVLTEYIQQNSVPEGTGVNPLYVRVEVSCTGILHATSPGDTLLIGKSLGVGNLADGYNAMIDELMQPGRAFAMRVGDQLIFDVVPGHVRPGLPNPNLGDTIDIRKTDVNHGPIPSVRVLGINSAHAMRIHFSVVMHLPYTDFDGQVPGGAISFRFWISEDIDCDDWTTERTYHGTFRVRHLGHNVLTEFRNNFVLPPLVEGFQRRHIGLQQSSNGLELNFTIVDKEVWARPPFPATSWRGKQTIFSPQPGGTMLYSEVYIKLKTDKKTPKWDLLSCAQKIFDTKLHRLDFVTGNRTFLQSFRFEDSFTDNEVEASANISLIPDKTMLWNLPKGNFGKPLNVGFPTFPSPFPEYNKDKADIVFPTACIQGLFVAALQDPLHITGFPLSNEEARQLQYGFINCQLVVNDPDIVESSNNLSPSQKASSYQTYRMESETGNTTGSIQLPLGKSNSQFLPNQTSSVLLTLHQGVVQCKVRVEAERINTWPNLPTPRNYLRPAGIEFAPLNFSITPSAPVLSADWIKSLYHTTAVYTFAQSRAAQEFVAGLMPYRIQGSQQANCYAMPASVFDDTILFS